MLLGAGLSREELIGRNYFEVYPHGENRAIFERVRQTGEASTFQAMPLVDPDRPERTPIYWDWTLAPVKDERGQVAGLVLSARDVSQRREAEIERERLVRQLEAERALLQAVIENAPEGIVVADSQGRIVLSNPAADRLYARPLPYGQDYASHAELGLCYPDGAPYDPRHLPLTRAALDGETHIGVDIATLWPDGQRRALRKSAAPIRDAQGRLTGAVSILEDVTQRQRAEQALRESEERFRSLADGAPVPIWLNGLEGCEFVNRAYLDFIGVDSQLDVQGYDWASFVHPEDREGYVNAYLECLARRAPFEAQFRFRRHDGVYRWMKTTGRPRLTPAGECLGYVGSTLDITDIKEAEETRRRQAGELEELVARRTAALQTSEARFRAIFEGAAVGISITGLDGRLIASNPALQAMVGYSHQELSSKAFSEFTHPDDVMSNLMMFQDLAAGQREGYNLEKRYVRKDGDVIWAHLSVSLVRGTDNQPEFAIAMVEDITRQKQAQAALVQSEKLAVVGRLTASLTHEINNPLQSVMGCLGLAQEALAEERDAARYLEVAKEELRRTARIVRQLRDLHRRPQALQREPADVNALIEQVLALNRPRCQALGIQVEWEPAEGLLPVTAVPGQLQQVFLNLVLNALDAMPAGGRLRVSTEASQRPAGVRVSFEDSGVGIPEAALPRIFDPFFTTREDGLGLGLFVCQNLVAEHGGRIQAESQVGAGATFTVWLPETGTPPDHGR
jgi:PAS domain S-box-containing protein